MKKLWQILAGVGMLVLGITGVIYASLYWLGLGGYIVVNIWRIMATLAAVMFIGALLGGIGFLMYRRRFGAVMGLVSFIGVLLFGWWLLAANLLMALWIFIPSPLPGFNWDVLLMVLGFFFMGLLLIIWGLTTYSMRGHTRIPSLATITAILFIASAVGYLVQLGPLSYMITIYDITSFVLAGGALLLIAGILNALIFFTIPTEHV